MPVDFTDNFSSPQRRNGSWSSLQEAQITHIWKLVLPIHDCSTQDVEADENLHVYTCTHNVKLLKSIPMTYLTVNVCCL